MAPINTTVLYGPAAVALRNLRGQSAAAGSPAVREKPVSEAPKHAAAQDVASYMPPPPPACGSQDDAKWYMPPALPVAHEGEPWPQEEDTPAYVSIDGDMWYMPPSLLVSCEGEPWPADDATHVDTLEPSTAAEIPIKASQPTAGEALDLLEPVTISSSADAVKDELSPAPATNKDTATEVPSKTPQPSTSYIPGNTPLSVMVAEAPVQPPQPTMGSEVPAKTAQHATLESYDISNWADAVDAEWGEDEPSPPWESWFNWPWNEAGRGNAYTTSRATSVQATKSTTFPRQQHHDQDARLLLDLVLAPTRGQRATAPRCTNPRRFPPPPPSLMTPTGRAVIPS